MSSKVTFGALELPDEDFRADPHWLKPLTPYLESIQATSRFRFTLYGGLSCFCLYVCIYAYRRPLLAVDLGREQWTEGVSLQIANALAQTLGLLVAKIYGIQYNAEAKRYNITLHLLVAVGVAEIALVAYAFVPHFWKPFAIFVTGLPLGVVWGLLVTYLEGRETSDVMLLFLASAIILGSGLMKEIGRWATEELLIDRFNMPAVVGAAAYPFVVLFAWLMYQLPSPSKTDQEMRTTRKAMFTNEREFFIFSQWPGLLSLWVAYMFLMAFREFRDVYEIDIFEAKGESVVAGEYLTMEISTAVIVLVALGGTAAFKDSKRAVRFIFVMCGIGASLLLLTLGLDLFIDMPAPVWYILLSAGNYVGYAAYNSVLFERLIAFTLVESTLAYPMVLSDIAGYAGSLACLFITAGFENKLHVLRVLGFGGGISLLIFWALAASYYFGVFGRSRAATSGGPLELQTSARGRRPRAKSRLHQDRRSSANPSAAPLATA